MRTSSTSFLILIVLLLILLFPALLVAEESDESEEAEDQSHLAAVIAAQEKEVKILKDSPIQSPDKIIKRSKKLNMYRCSDCHYEPEEFNTSKRALEEDHHDDKAVHFEGEDGERWCHGCHRLGDYDYLQLQNGKKVTFDQSFHLCGECHSTIFRDWKLNLHGKRVGEWNGEKQVYSCAECHDPHNPKFKSMKPWDPPKRARTVGKSYFELVFGDFFSKDEEEEKVEEGE